LLWRTVFKCIGALSCDENVHLYFSAGSRNEDTQEYENNLNMTEYEEID
jgi:hypothetical protein